MGQLLKLYLGHLLVTLVAQWIFCVVGTDPSKVVIETILDQCCTTGEQLANSSKNCSEFRPDTKVVPAELFGACIFSANICCMRDTRISHCKSGILAAQNGLSCTVPLSTCPNRTIDEYYTNCCEACTIGMLIGGTIVDKECKQRVVYGGVFDDAAYYCCTEVKTIPEGTFTLTDDKNLCQKFDRLCSQICENTEGSYICKCYPGYRLRDDRITCENITDNSSNSIDSIGCSTGYERNDVTGECEDLNECELGTATCIIDQQVCINKLGTYACLDIVPEKIQCPSGYRYNLVTSQCDDINECIEELDTCNRKTEVCFNLRGNYTCENKIMDKCLPGFRMENNNCVDIDECEEERPCSKRFKCVNQPGGYECAIGILDQTSDSKNPLKPSHQTCAHGYKEIQHQCIDIDECVVDPEVCDQYQYCINEPGSYTCACKAGFTFDKVTNACVDINECQINNHDCLLETQRCDNTIGSYTCIRLQSCGTGYTINAGTGYCDDDDECILNTHNCRLPYECRNTKGSFRCEKPRPTHPPKKVPSTTTKPITTTTTTTTTTQRPTRQAQTSTQRITYQHPIYHRYHTDHPTTISSRSDEYNRYYGPCNIGFERNTQGACADIDECIQSSVSPCQRNQRCINTNGSYRCQMLIFCSGGYESNEDGTRCIDIDECGTGKANCSPDQVCRNRPGGYSCQCPVGHVLDQFGRCADENECERYPHVCPDSTECRNTIGSYECECKPGFKKNNPDEKVCHDVDECSELGPGLCQQQCINIWGSFRCTCDSGYILNENNRSCDDIDECSVHKSYDLCMGMCDNTPGSYRCTCPAGYKLGADGRSCRDIDECKTEPVCRGQHEQCTNIRGSYRCTRIQCPAGYEFDFDKPNYCVRKQCEWTDRECQRRPTMYIYYFITTISNSSVPPNGLALMNLRGPLMDYMEFDFKIVGVQAPTNIQRVTEHYFTLRKLKANEVTLQMIRSIEGPQDIEIDITTNMFGQDGQPRDNYVAKLMIFISEFNF